MYYAYVTNLISTAILQGTYYSIIPRVSLSNLPNVSGPNTGILPLELIPWNTTLYPIIENNLKSLEQTWTCLIVGLLL